MWPPSWTRSSSGGSCAAATPSPSPSPAHPYFAFSSLKDLHSLLAEEPNDSEEPSSTTSLHKHRPSIFHRVRIATSTLRAWRSLSSLASSPDPVTDYAEKRIVVYFTSLRVVRKTFEDCWTVRSILRGLRLAVDERDVSMDSQFLDELKGMLRRRQVTLPGVFIGGRYVGGADEIRQLHESGEFKRYVEGVPAAAGVCECCGGIGFVLCQSCDGSHKQYSEKGGFRSCAACNENGLVSCPNCHISGSI